MIACFLSSVQAKPPHVSSTRILGNRQIHFLTSYVWRFWDRSRHFFELLMCAAPIYWDLRQFEICRHFCRGCGSPGDLQYPGYYQRVGRDTIHFAYPGFHKDYLLWGPWCAFQFTKVTSASPHTIQEYQPWYGFCISKLLNPWPAAPGQDALGLITIYPRPDEHRILLQHSADADRSPAKTLFLPILILP